MVNETRGIATETGKGMRLLPAMENSVSDLGVFPAFLAPHQ